MIIIIIMIIIHFQSAESLYEWFIWGSKHSTCSVKTKPMEKSAISRKGQNLKCMTNYTLHDPLSLCICLSVSVSLSHLLYDTWTLLSGIPWHRRVAVPELCSREWFPTESGVVGHCFVLFLFLSFFFWLLLAEIFVWLLDTDGTVSVFWLIMDDLSFCLSVC